MAYQAHYNSKVPHSPSQIKQRIEERNNIFTEAERTVCKYTVADGIAAARIILRESYQINDAVIPQHFLNGAGAAITLEELNAASDVIVKRTLKAHHIF